MMAGYSTNTLRSTSPANKPEVWDLELNGLDSKIEAQYHNANHSYAVSGVDYSEGSVVWVPLERGITFGCNLDLDQPCGSKFKPILLPPDPEHFIRKEGDCKYFAPAITNEMGGLRGWLPNETDFIYALSHCDEYNGPGIFLFCRDGKFGVLVDSHYYDERDDIDYLVCIFNADTISVGHRKTWLKAIVQIENDSFMAIIRYVPGAIYRWDYEQLMKTVDGEYYNPLGDWSEE